MLRHQRHFRFQSPNPLDLVCVLLLKSYVCSWCFNGFSVLNMRLTMQKIAAPARRGLHTITTAPRPRRSLHQTAIAALPRKRTFFSSNQLLANSETAAYSQDLAVDDAPAQLPQTSQPAKRKPVRSSSKNLRQASMTKKTKRAITVDKKNLVAEVIGTDDLDYQTTVKAICVAESFDMDVVDEILRYHGFEIDPDGTDVDPDAVIHARGVNNGDIFVFESGTVVAWSVPADTVLKIATKQLIRAAEGPHVDQLEMEDLRFVTDDSRDTSYMRDEVVVLGTRAEMSKGDKLDVTLAKIAFSSGLARSPKLAVLENNMVDFIEKSKSLSASLAGGSEVPLKRKFILERTHELLTLRSQLNHYSDLTDPLPDMFWDRESRLEEYYERVGNILDVRSRIAQLNRKIDYAHELVSVFREMSSEKQGLRLEWIIIILISVEVAFELRRVYIEEFGARSGKGDQAKE